MYLAKPGKGFPLCWLVELKGNRSVVGAIRQIKEKQYPSALEGYGGELLLVEINYYKGSGNMHAGLKNGGECPLKYCTNDVQTRL